MFSAPLTAVTTAGGERFSHGEVEFREEFHFSPGKNRHALADSDWPTVLAYAVVPQATSMTTMVLTMLRSDAPSRCFDSCSADALAEGSRR